MNFFDNPTIRGLENYLEVTALREKITTANIANIDTPGYRTLDINFLEALHNAALHAGGTPFAPLVFHVQGLIERPDGNNVSVDRESVILTGVQLEYRAAVALLHQEFKQIEAAINANGGA
ncbi:MAG TPA: flagellar basal body rod protein FlgB [Terriglobia bacterium]|jgi:flagellar basal-body rod protein FlgB|nr:flagellar basal body rod protein FlgB [Terriglobia bacterium]